MIARTALAAAALAAYVALGMATYGTTVDRTQDACVASPGYAAHVAMWPISYGTSAGMKSGC